MIRARAKRLNWDVNKIAKRHLMSWFTEELYERGVITERDHDEYWGKYYKFPKCCIDYFCNLVGHGVSLPSKYSWEIFPNQPFQEINPRVLCPTCLSMYHFFKVLNTQFVKLP
jgi:hypothetical protein